MSTNLLSCLLTSIIVCSDFVLGTVPEPKHVTVSSVNLGAVLQWDPVTAEDNITYTAEFARAFNEKHYIEVCQNIRETKCDFTGNISAFGIFHFRVKSARQGNASQWVYVKGFAADQYTRIGPPSDVKVKSRSGYLDINISDPPMKIKNKTLRDIFVHVSYLVTYWKNTPREEVKTIRSEQTFLVLGDLEPWSTYCVQVQISVNSNRTGEPSRPVCERTTSEGKTSGWMIAVILICSLVAVTTVILCLFFAGFYTYKTVHFLFPSCNLPEHYKELLTATPNSYAFLDIQNNKELDEICDEISIVFEQPASPVEAIKTEQESKETLEEHPLVEGKDNTELRKDIPHYGNLN
ncbi:interleukin-10 receptor subunit beta-like [Polyodon spathula]|uniref:interleukin-10 receptor subunit beta-like n=1 Tax=Polyodon spathula TaxID=7913 RepID=UPI001B7DF5B2|nr:interleukin-10 receptor subunit beta-like [Polyodon spathula]